MKWPQSGHLGVGRLFGHRDLASLIPCGPRRIANFFSLCHENASVVGANISTSYGFNVTARACLLHFSSSSCSSIPFPNKAVDSRSWSTRHDKSRSKFSDGPPRDEIKLATS